MDPDTEFLTIEGQKEPVNLNDYPNVVYYGEVLPEQRREMLSRATGLIQPTFYFEPCPWNVIEALFSGTPVLVPNSGGFVNIIPHQMEKGKPVGYLCGTDDWVNNIHLLTKVNPEDCHKYALATFSEKRAYQEYLAFCEWVRNK